MLRTRKQISKKKEQATIDPYYTRASGGLRRENCFAFAVGMRGGVIGIKPQPGEVSGMPAMKGTPTCRDLTRRALKDLGTQGRRKPKRGECAAHEDEIAMQIDDSGRQRDYHFLLRRAGDKLWSHKRGLGTPSRFDACGKEIADPSHMCADWGGGLNYARQCPTRICFKRDSKHPLRPALP